MSARGDVNRDSGVNGEYKVDGMVKLNALGVDVVFEVNRNFLLLYIEVCTPLRCQIIGLYLFWRLHSESDGTWLHADCRPRWAPYTPCPWFPWGVSHEKVWWRMRSLAVKKAVAVKSIRCGTVRNDVLILDCSV